jgi:hypothetical protein
MNFSAESVSQINNFCSFTCEITYKHNKTVSENLHSSSFYVFVPVVSKKNIISCIPKYVKPIPIQYPSRTLCTFNIYSYNDHINNFI